MLGFILAGFAGLSLGLLGGGGSILTVPILVYALSIDPKVAVAMSLAIVGMTTLFGVFGHYKNKNIDFRIALIFGGAALPATFLGSYLSQFISGSIQLIIFATVMILAATFMFRDRLEAEEKQFNLFLTLISGLVVGLMTGLIGVGGGFLIVPALMYFTGTNMKKSVGTSLFIISFNSFFGFMSYIDKVEIDWIFLAKFTSCSVIGILIGSKLVQYVPQKILKKAFAVFLIVMGIFILVKNLSL
jgi:uncharacterized membrane protein YfcA